MKKLLVYLLVFCISLPATFHTWAASATFTADTTTELPNQERGWYARLSESGGEFCNSVLTNIRDGNWSYTSKVNLFLYEFNPTSLGSIAANLTCVRAAGVKVILTGMYCTGNGCVEGRTIAQVESDIAAFGVIIAPFRDTIAAVRAGWIGSYGEWANSGSGLDTAANKIRVRNALLAAVPPEIPILIRQPATVQSWYGSQLNATTRFEGLAQSRIGHYNDCYMAGTSDSSTYPGATTVVDLTYTTNAASQRAFASAQNNGTMFGGETCDNSADFTATGGRLGCGNGGTDNAGLIGGIMNEGPRYYQTFLHRDYSDTFTNTYISGGCFNTVMNRLGYRFQYDSIVHADTMTHGTTNTFTLTMHNYGWARIYSTRQVQVRLVKAAAADIVCRFTPQLRTLEPQATVSTGMQAKCPIPSGATVGSYAVYLEIPDVFSTATNYKIQNANTNSGGQTWDSSNRRWATGTTVTVN